MDFLYTQSVTVIRTVPRDILPSAPSWRVRVITDRGVGNDWCLKQVLLAMDSGW